MRLKVQVHVNPDVLKINIMIARNDAIIRKLAFIEHWVANIKIIYYEDEDQQDYRKDQFSRKFERFQRDMNAILFDQIASDTLLRRFYKNYVKVRNQQVGLFCAYAYDFPR